jgi:molybdopterin molybdotransferase
MELFKVVTIEEAKDIIKNNFNRSLGYEEVNIAECCGRILSEDLYSHENIPGFRRSTVDGYAVNSKEIAGANEAIPALMDYVGEVHMGAAPERDITFPGQCIYVPTGGMLPQGADAVAMIEYTEKLDDNTILINSPAAYGENVTQIGEDIALGELILKKGSKIRPYEVGVLSSLGISNIKACRQPKIGVISTGDEIVDINLCPKPGEVRDINTYLLHSSIIEDGGTPVIYGVIQDDYFKLKETVENALNQCDIVLISGGSSVGKKDQTLKVMESFEDGEVLVHGIAVKPGKPTIIGKTNGKIIFGLPGHPLACSLIYKLLVRDYINSLTGFAPISYPVIAQFKHNYHKSKGREEYLPVTLEKEGNKIIASPVLGKSGLISVYSKAWGFVRIDRNLEGINEGATVEVYKL